MKTEINSSETVKRFNFLVGLFDYETGGLYDDVGADRIAEYFDLSNAEMAAEFRDLIFRIYGTK